MTQSHTSDDWADLGPMVEEYFRSGGHYAPETVLAVMEEPFDEGCEGLAFLPHAEQVMGVDRMFALNAGGRR